MAEAFTLSTVEPVFEFPLSEPPERTASNVRHVVCPGCEARFLVDDAAFTGGEGRRLRCASCGHVWQYSPDPRGRQPAFLDEAAKAKAATAPAAAPVASPIVSPAEPDRREPMFAAELPPPGPSALARPSVAAERKARGGAVKTGILGVAVLAAALMLVAILGRDRIATTWPGVRPVYAMLGLAKPVPEVPGAGLKVTVTPTRSADAIVVAGDIVNGASAARRVPRLRLTLLDRNKTDLTSKVISPPVAHLQPGATAHFNVVFEHPTNNAVRIDVTFAD